MNENLEKKLLNKQSKNRHHNNKKDASLISEYKLDSEDLLLLKNY